MKRLLSVMVVFTLCVAMNGCALWTGAETSSGKRSPEDAVAAFLDDIRLAKSADGVVTIEADAPRVAQAARRLRDEVLVDDEPGSQHEFTHDGLRIRVGRQTCGGGCDLVVAVGFEAKDSSSGEDATASNSETGGCAIAVAGHGGPNASTGGGHAQSSANVGVALAIAGDGQAGTHGGGPGGNATAHNIDAKGRADAFAGDGGDPRALQLQGGRGGDAEASVEGVGSLRTLGGAEDVELRARFGIYGTGARASLAPGHVGGSNGKTEANVRPH